MDQLPVVAARKPIRLLAAAVLSLMAAGCSATADGDAVATSRAGIVVPPGSSSHQRDVVERYKNGEEVSFEDYRQAVNDTETCLVAAGFVITDEAISSAGGITTVDFTAQAPKALVDAEGDDAVDAAYDECWTINVSAVQALYLGAPRSVEQQTADLAALQAEFAPKVIACLANLGITAGASSDEKWWLAASVEASQELPGAPDCLRSSGYSDAVAQTPED